MADIEDSFHSSQRDIDAYAGESSRVSFRTLFIFNAVMFGVHLIVAIAIFVLSSTNENFESFRLHLKVFDDVQKMLIYSKFHNFQRFGFRTFLGIEVCAQSN